MRASPYPNSGRHLRENLRCNADSLAPELLQLLTDGKSKQRAFAYARTGSAKILLKVLRELPIENF